MRRTVENHLKRFENRFAESKITLRDDYFSENEAVLAEMGPIWNDYERLWVAIIEEGQKKGVFDATLEPRIAHLGILGLCNWARPLVRAGKIDAGARSDRHVQPNGAAQPRCGPRRRLVTPARRASPHTALSRRLSSL